MRVSVSFLFIIFPSLVWSQCDETVLHGSYALRGELHYDERAAYEYSVVPISAKVAFDGAGTVALSEGAASYFADSSPNKPELDFVIAEGTYEVSPECSGGMFLVYTFEPGTRDYQRYPGPITEMYIAFTLYGQGNVAEGFYGVATAIDVDDNDCFGDIGRFEAKRLSLSAPNIEAMPVATQQQGTNLLDNVNRARGR